MLKLSAICENNLLISSPYADAQSLYGDAGEVYIIYGNKDIAKGGNFNTSILDGNNGYTIQGTFSGDKLGWTGSSTGDVNGDGVADYIVTAPDNGKAYLLFGKAF